MYYGIDPYRAYLYHWGIKGQRKGERRYQNPDGTYTEIGKIRKRKNAQANRTITPSEDYKKARTGKTMPEMSNQELRTATERFNLERNYSTAVNPQKSHSFKDSKIAIAAGWIAGIGALMGTTAALVTNAQKIAPVAKKIAAGMKSAVKNGGKKVSQVSAAVKSSGMPDMVFSKTGAGVLSEIRKG